MVMMMIGYCLLHQKVYAIHYVKIFFTVKIVHCLYSYCTYYDSAFFRHIPTMSSFFPFDFSILTKEASISCLSCLDYIHIIIYQFIIDDNIISFPVIKILNRQIREHSKRQIMSTTYQGTDRYSGRLIIEPIASQTFIFELLPS